MADFSPQICLSYCMGKTNCCIYTARGRGGEPYLYRQKVRGCPLALITALMLCTGYVRATSFFI